MCYPYVLNAHTYICIVQSSYTGKTMIPNVSRTTSVQESYMYKIRTNLAYDARTDLFKANLHVLLIETYTLWFVKKLTVIWSLLVVSIGTAVSAIPIAEWSKHCNSTAHCLALLSSHLFKGCVHQSENVASDLGLGGNFCRVLRFTTG